MSKEPSSTVFPPVGFDMASLVLGFIALLLFFMPVLGVPVAVCGLACGGVGLLMGGFGGTSSLRWVLGGLAMSLLGLIVNAALYWAPEPAHYRRPPPWQPPPTRPYVSPPA